MEAEIIFVSWTLNDDDQNSEDPKWRLCANDAGSDACHEPWYVGIKDKQGEAAFMEEVEEEEEEGSLEGACQGPTARKNEWARILIREHADLDGFSSRN